MEEFELRKERWKVSMEEEEREEISRLESQKNQRIIEWKKQAEDAEIREKQMFELELHKRLEEWREELEIQNRERLEELSKVMIRRLFLRPS